MNCGGGGRHGPSELCPAYKHLFPPRKRRTFQLRRWDVYADRQHDNPTSWTYGDAARQREGTPDGRHERRWRLPRHCGIIPVASAAATFTPTGSIHGARDPRASSSQLTLIGRVPLDSRCVPFWATDGLFMPACERACGCWSLFASCGSEPNCPRWWFWTLISVSG